MGNILIFPQYDVITDPLTGIFIGSARFSPLGFPSIAAPSFPEMQWADNSNVSPSSKPLMYYKQSLLLLSWRVRYIKEIKISFHWHEKLFIFLWTHIAFQSADLQAFYHHHKPNSKEGERSTRDRASQVKPTRQTNLENYLYIPSIQWTEQTTLLTRFTKIRPEGITDS